MSVVEQLESTRVAILELLEKTGMNRTELARRLHVTRSRVTQLLDDDYVCNPTVATLTRIAEAADHELVIEFQPRRTR